MSQSLSNKTDSASGSSESDSEERDIGMWEQSTPNQKRHAAESHGAAAAPNSPEEEEERKESQMNPERTRSGSFRNPVSWARRATKSTRHEGLVGPPTSVALQPPGSAFNCLRLSSSFTATSPRLWSGDRLARPGS
ncbi:hypothetical protein NHX12_007176 [Muraenolepis orangiensis]|uniref:Uncharacterized protein n=1 Tax=Muraenolepis orangiensis TaxID=630683 RepID=A0A9Q0ICR2_9TELE|nr:hypothetical protein NHX12_007176 [Muraenolepis orangiensis]